MWLHAGTYFFALLVHLATPSAYSPREAVVYPHFMESRAANGENVLKISDDLTLTLEQQPVFGEQLLIRTLGNGGTDEYQYVDGSEYNKYLFQDRKQLASVAVSNEDGLRVHGVIGDELRIKPMATMERTSQGHVPHLLYHEESLSSPNLRTDYVDVANTPSSKLSNQIPHDDYISVKLNETGDGTGDTPSDKAVDVTTTPSSNLSTQIPHDDYISVKLNETGDGTGDTPSANAVSVSIGPDGVASLRDSPLVNIEQRSDDEIFPEVHLVIDSTYFSAFKRNTQDIILYLGVSTNSVNLRYETIRHPRIRVKIVGFTFNNGPYAEPYIITYRGYEKYLDSSNTLQAFNSYYMGSILYSTADVMMLITGKDMATVSGGVLQPGVAGLAYLGGACTNVRTGLCEDVAYSYRVVRVLAHELAHSLGCVHDGEGPNRNVPGHPGASACPWNDGFIMSYVQKDNREYMFSSCCATQIQFMYKHYTHSCLHTNNTKKEIVPPKYLPGSKVSLSELCRKTYAHSGDTFFHDKSRDLGPCKIACRNQGITYGYQIRWNVGQAQALDGSPCGRNDSNMICIRGECVKDERYTGKNATKPTNTTTRTPLTTQRTTNLNSPRSTTPTTRRPGNHHLSWPWYGRRRTWSGLRVGATE